MAVTPACDSHVQVFGPPERFPIAAVDETVPEPLFRSDPDACRDAMVRLGIGRCILIQPVAYGTDHACLLEAMETLSRGSDDSPALPARGTARIRADCADAVLEDLAAAGITGAVFEMDGPAPAYEWPTADRLAWRLHDLGWTVELEVNGCDLQDVEPILRSWPGRVAIAHIGLFRRTQSLTQRGFKALTRLIDGDGIWVKLSAPYRSSRTGSLADPAVGDIARALIDWAPERMVWGSNWPHPCRTEDPPGESQLLRLLDDWVPEESRRNTILRDNPAELYRFT